jgi:WXG100 family type VII secretion target
MPARLRIAYNETLAAANQLSSESSDIRNMYNQLKNQTEHLHGHGFRGLSSEAWFKQMEDTLLPKTNQLADILEQSSEMLKRLNSLFQQADQEVGGLFKSRG